MKSYMNNLFAFILCTFTLLCNYNLHSFENCKNIDHESHMDAQEEKSNKLSELPLHTQLAHKNLIRKLALLKIHQNFIFEQNEALLKLMQQLEEGKDERGNITQEHANFILSESKFPQVSELRPPLEELKDCPYIGYKIENCLEVLTEKKFDLINKWFELLENEIESEINTYEEVGIPLSQYRYILGLYSNAKRSLQINFQLMVIMNKELFKE